MTVPENTPDTELELQLQLDIQDVFSTLFPEDDPVVEAEIVDESSQPETSNVADKPLRSELTFSKQELKRAVDALVATDDQAPIPRGAKRSKFINSSDPIEQSSLTTFLPFSQAAYAARLSTYNLLSFSSPAFTAQDASTFGWINKGRNRLVCASCQAAWVVSSFKGLGDKPASRLKERMRRELLEAHMKPCPWRTSQTDPTSFGDVTGYLMTDELVRRAIEIDKLADLQHAQLIHPLESHQVASLLPNTSSSSSRPSTPAILLSFFNWIPIPTSASASTTTAATTTTRTIINSPDPTQPKQLLVSCSTCRRRLAIPLESSPTSQSQTQSQSSSEPCSTQDALSEKEGRRNQRRGTDIRAEHTAECLFGTDNWTERLALMNKASGNDEKEVFDSRSIKSKLDAMLGPKMTTADRRVWQAEVSKLSTLTPASTLTSTSTFDRSPVSLRPTNSISSVASATMNITPVI